MTLTATYLDDLSRVRLSFTGAPSGADYALIERSTDQITWATVRGGDAVPINAGAGKLDDYEFAPGVPNYYRVSYVDQGPITGVAFGTAAKGNNVSLTPALPAGIAAGDLLLLFASIRNSGAGTVNTPAGWTQINTNAAGNQRLYARRYVVGDTAPTVTFTGGAAGADTIAITGAWRNAYEVPHTVAVSNNTVAAQNINTPAMTITALGTLDIFFGWKQSSWTSVGDVYAQTEVTSTAGGGAGEVIDWTVQGATALSFTAGAWVVTGGSSAISSALSQAFVSAPYITRDTATITPNMSVIWLKNPRRPNLNTPVTVTEFSAITRPARAGVFDVISRTMPVAVTDVRGSRRLTLTVTTVDLAAADELDARLAQGDPVLIHTPGGVDCPVPSMYAVVGDLTIDRHSKRTKRRFFDLPLTEVAAPPGTVYSQTATYGDILTAYATYAAVLTAEPTYSDVLDYIAPAGDVITP